jgi:predicted dienelactone hydrolase
MSKLLGLIARVVLCTSCFAAQAAVGMVELPANAVSGPITIFYPTLAASSVVQRGPFGLDVALDSPPSADASRLVIISHGSPGSPWVHVDLVRSLVNAGFVVALPEHHADNYRDDSDPGPPAWRRRPQEISKAIDRLAQEPAFAPTLDFARIGMFGMSAGGHTALTLAGGRWSPSRLRTHCQLNLAEDFHACAGPSVALTGGALDGAKKWVVNAVNDRKLADSSWYDHVDTRIAAVVAAVPFAADFEPESLRHPKVALALVSARKDRWLNPRYHSDVIAEACRSCVRLVDSETGGHGALLGPLPPSASDLVQDPPEFDRHKEVPKLNSAIADFFRSTLREAVR